MARIDPATAGGQNVVAFLDMIAYSELGPGLIAASDDGYNVCVGSTPEHLILMPDYTAHPKLHNVAENSDAAGRYQFMGKYWSYYKTLLGLPDFGKLSQDRWAIQDIAECRALVAVKAGHFQEAVFACRHIWASFPGADYGQHENKISALQLAYTQAGGTIA